MKSLANFAIGAAVLPLMALAAPVAQAEGLIVLPYLFADEYCNLRSVGVTKHSALKGAMDIASIPGTSTVVVKEDGTTGDLDAIQAARAIGDRCPEYL